MVRKPFLILAFLLLLSLTSCEGAKMVESPSDCYIVIMVTLEFVLLIVLLLIGNSRIDKILKEIERMKKE